MGDEGSFPSSQMTPSPRMAPHVGMTSAAAWFIVYADQFHRTTRRRLLNRSISDPRTVGMCIGTLGQNFRERPADCEGSHQFMDRIVPRRTLSSVASESEPGGCQQPKNSLEAAHHVQQTLIPQSPRIMMRGLGGLFRRLSTKTCPGRSGRQLQVLLTRKMWVGWALVGTCERCRRQPIRDQLVVQYAARRYRRGTDVTD